jgi:hypothetical protein
MCAATNAFQGRTDRRLAIVVPYRDRAAHLQQFIPHILDYFCHDKIDRKIQFQIHVIEQHGTKEFNRGKLLNCGYSIVKAQCDYVCFHDVDYLPIWADYTYDKNPARLCWHGLTHSNDYEGFFGAVVLFSKKHFNEINGYPNCYWGWGCEDVELRLRCETAGLEIDKRDGVYTSLTHPHSGFDALGAPTDEAKMTHELFGERRKNVEGLMRSDGLNSLGFRVLGQSAVFREGVRLTNVFHHIVDIDE